MAEVAAPHQPRRFVVFGDSISFGQGVSLHKGWVPRISAHIEALAAKTRLDLVVVNSSVNGSTTRQALERMPYEVQSHGVDILLVQFGMNDCNYWQTDHGLPRVSPAAFRANLQEIISRAFRFGARRILLNTNHPTGRDREKLPFGEITYQDSNRSYNEIIRAVGRGSDPRILFTDIEGVFEAETRGDRRRLETLLLPDLLHPSENGHDLYFLALRKTVEQAVAVLTADPPDAPR
jgi:lysophospholipase L1-like esterase